VFLCGNLVVNSDINSGFIGYKPTTMEIWWWSGWWFGTREDQHHTDQAEASEDEAWDRSNKRRLGRRAHQPGFRSGAVQGFPCEVQLQLRSLHVARHQLGAHKVFARCRTLLALEEIKGKLRSKVKEESSRRWLVPTD
jgi:hypothetical protein